MSGLTLLDVAIATVFFFLLLSLVCSAANEIFAALLQTRARFLERGIHRLLITDEFAGKLYQHALIRSLADEVDSLFKTIHRALPSYIPSKTFALTILDLLRTDAAAVPREVNQALTALLNDVGQDSMKVQSSIEEWYNNAMDRVSGAYKRRVQYVLFALGLTAAIVMNADSIAVVERLSTNKTLSNAVADAAQLYVSSPNRKAAIAPTDDVALAQHKLHDTIATLDKLELPIGWAGTNRDDTVPVNGDGFLQLTKTHLVGWLITALAVSFGAPFWFDVLNRFMIVRSTVKPQEKSQTEPSKS